MKKDKCYDLLDAWLGTIDKEVWDLREKRAMFSELHKMISSNPKINQPNAFYVWMNSTYATSMSVAIRRQLDRVGDTVSLLRFLDKLKDNPGVLTRERYKRAFAKLSQSENDLDARFNALVGEGRDSLDPRKVEGQIEELVKPFSELKEYVNKRLAHHEDGEFQASATLSFRYIDEAVDCISRIFQYYFHLFKGGDPDVPQPALRSDSWKVIFRYPWIDPACCESTN